MDRIKRLWEWFTGTEEGFVLMVLIIAVGLIITGFGLWINTFEPITLLEYQLVTMQDSVQTLNVLLSEAGVADYVKPMTCYSPWWIPTAGFLSGVLTGYMLCALMFMARGDDDKS